MVMICLSLTDSHEISGLTASLFVFLSPTSCLLCPFQPFTPHTYVLPTVNLLLSWFSDKKLERGK